MTKISRIIDRYKSNTVKSNFSMAINSISEDDFYKYKPVKSPFTNAFANEVSWYADTNKRLIGTVLLDLSDNDWGYVIMAIHEDGQYRSVDVNVSIESQDTAEEELVARMNLMDHKGEIKQVLFKDDSDLDISKINITDINSEIKKYFKKHPEKLYELAPRKFEELIADIFHDLGFFVELTKATRDGGRDIIARIKNSVTEYLTYVECKRYAADNKIGVGIIREVCGVHYLNKPSQSIIVTTSFFSPDAIEEAKTLENQLALKDYSDIKKWLSKY